MSAPQTVIVDALVAALTGTPDVGIIVRGGLSDVAAQTSAQSATVCIEYGALEPADPQTGQSIVGAFDGRLDMLLDVYWAGPPAVWEPRVFECAAAIWRAVMAMALPPMVLRIRPMGHAEPEIDVGGDNQHVVLRNVYRFDVRFSITDPEA